MSVQCDDNHCLTCSDEGVPMRVLGAGSQRAASCIDDDGRWQIVYTDLVGAVAPGDALLVHAGVALTRLDARVGVSA